MNAIRRRLAQWLWPGDVLELSERPKETDLSRLTWMLQRDPDSITQAVSASTPIINVTTVRRRSA